MSDPGSSCPYDLLDAPMCDRFLQQAFRQLDQRHMYGIIARVCHSWHHLSITSSSSLTVKVSTALSEQSGEPDDAISFSRWLQQNIGNLTRLDLTLVMLRYTFDTSEMLQTITNATQLCSLRLYEGVRYLSESFEGFSALTNLTSLALSRCELRFCSYSSVLALTQLRALELKDVYVLVTDEEEKGKVMTSSLVNLTSLTLNDFSGWRDLEQGLVCIRTLTMLMDLDMSGMEVPSRMFNLLGGLPISGVRISLSDPGHVSEVAGWLERCIPTTLRRLDLSIIGSSPYLRAGGSRLQPSQVARLLSPLKSAGAQLQELTLRWFDISQANMVNTITGLTQRTRLELNCGVDDDGWALLEASFPHLEVLIKDRVYCHCMCWFRAALVSQAKNWPW